MGIVEPKMTVVSEYNDLQESASKLLEKAYLRCVFSIFEDADLTDDSDGDRWLVKHPDIFSTEPVIEGEVKIKYGSWLSNGKYIKVSNPTWKDLINFFDNSCTGDHIFFEGLYLEDGELTLIAGS